MIVAVPILIAVSLFLCWCLVRLTIHALPLFAAVTVTSLLLHIGASIVPALVGGGLTALLVIGAGRSLAARSHSRGVRAAVMLAFAAPASFAAYHAVMGLTALATTSDAWRTVWAVMTALIVAGAAGREVARSRHHRLAG